MLVRDIDVLAASVEKMLPESRAGMRGYVTREDGSTTTYFHREITEEAKALLSDSTPKRISSPSLLLFPF